MAAEAHTARLFAAHQHVTAEHFGGDVLEAHRLLQHGAAQVIGHQLHQVRAAHGFDDRTAQTFGAGQVIDEQWHQQLGAAEASVLIHRSDAIAIAVKHDAHRWPAGQSRSPHLRDQLLQIGGEGFRWIAAEEGVAVRADFAQVIALGGALQQATEPSGR